MRIVDLIMKKRDGNTLSDEEIGYFVDASVSGEIADYQISAMLMALWFQGMDSRETSFLTEKMARSGDMADLSDIPGIKADKHSTGGVGDKTTLIVGPIVAACGVPVAKMSGRGLGHTGGTLDKLESIPGMRVTLDRDEFLRVVKEVGISVIGQSGNIAPADKIFYALRDVTGTVDSIPLIAASIMSKKLAAGSDAIVLDVKCGSGAFMKDMDSALELAHTMVDIGERNGRRTSALITDMDQPLGFAVGNALEVAEAASTLRGDGPEDLTYLCLHLASAMLELSGAAKGDKCLSMASEALHNGAAFETLSAMVSSQGGDAKVLELPELFAPAPVERELLSPKDGYISHMDTVSIGLAACALGAGRTVKNAPVDHRAGILFHRKTGDLVKAGEPLCRLYTSKPEALSEAEGLLISSLSFSSNAPVPRKLILARVSKDGARLT